MNLHRIEGEAEWHGVEPERLNKHQRFAKKTHGIGTLATALSVGGSALVVSGLYDYGRGRQKQGFAKMAAGRLCDLADGYVANRTRTKSPFGEAVDASLDKLLMASAIPVLTVKGTMPTPAGALICSQSYEITRLSIEAKKNDMTLHPSKEGKQATFAVWAAVGFYALSEMRQAKLGGGSLRRGGHAMSAISVLRNHQAAQLYRQTLASGLQPQ